jgi:hypothetical protein
MFLVSTRISTRIFVIVFVFVFLGLRSEIYASDGNNREDIRPTPNEAENWADYPVTFRLVWFDTYRLLPHSFKTMSQEVHRIYSRAGVNIVLDQGQEEQGRVIDTDPLSVNVVLLPSNSTDWGLKRTVMGVATHREGLKGSIYVFYPSVLRTMQLERSMGPVGSPRSMKYLARAIARVVSHELVHILAPHRPHTVGGLMNSRLTRKYLLAKRVHFDSDSARVVHTEIRARISQVQIANVRRKGADEDVEVATDRPLVKFRRMEGPK